MEAQTTFKTLDEIRLQCRFGLFSWQSLRAALNGMDAEKSFFFADALLGHALTVSRWLWPKRDASRERGEWLCKELTVPDDSPLRLSSLRETLERPDESHEDWLAALENKNYIESSIMPQTAIGDVKPEIVQRHLDPDVLRYSFRQRSCELAKIAEALRLLDHTATGWLRTHNPW